MTAEQLEALAIRAALGNNGGTWAGHYTEDQKEHWRQWVWDMSKTAHQWQPIETAPKPTEGRGVIPVLLALHCPNGKFWGCMVMAWNRHNQDWDDGMGNSTGDWDADSAKPTHWMPLPEPPK